MVDWLKKRKTEGAKDVPRTHESQTEWEELSLRVSPSSELQIVRQRFFCEKRKCLVGENRTVIYLEDEYNPKVNAFIVKYYDDIVRNFGRLGFTFIYAPKEVEKVAREYAASIPDVEWNAEIILDLFHCSLHEPIGSVMVLFDETRNYRCAFPEQPIIGTLIGIQLDADTEEGVMAILKAYWNRLEEDYCNPPTMSYCVEVDSECRCVTGSLFFEEGGSAQSQRDEEARLYRQQKIKEAEERKCVMQSERKRDTGDGFFSSIMRKAKKVDDSVGELAIDFLIEEDAAHETLTPEDEQLLREIQERIERLRHSGIRQQLIEQMVRMTVKPSPLLVTCDARLMLTDYNKEVKMLPMDKVVYIFFLRHPEGVAIKALCDHRDELAGIYARMLGQKTLTNKQQKSIELLCTPYNNSINEKISRIRSAFRAVAHDSVANCYIIQGERGEKRSITLNDDFIELGEWGKEMI